MKLTIEITKEEYEGIKKYITEVDGNSNPKKQDVIALIEGELNAAFQSPHSALSDYITNQNKL